jgi:hypothetical protein
MPDHPRVVAAQRWLTAIIATWRFRDSWVRLIGVGRKGLAFYYSAASAEAFQRIATSTRAMEVADGLRRTQPRDGSWVIPENLVKEDDPLIATPFAVRALIASGK